MMQKMNVRFASGIALAILTVLLTGAVGLWGQAVNTGTISGTVTDSSGSAVVGAMVTIKNTGTGVTNMTVTDNQGRYDMPGLIIGTYEVDVEAAGFKKAVHGGITLTVGAQLVVDASLEVGNLQQTVTVEADVSHVETTEAAVTTLVEQTQMTDLPLNGRNYQQLVALAPGVLPVSAGQGGNQAKYAIGGSRLAGQAYLLDGSDTINYWGNATGSGALGTALGLDSIAEFNLLMNNYSAQYGGAGAVMNATTKSGTNNFHGTVYEYIRNSAWEASNNYQPSLFPLSPTVLDRNQFGASLGGPVKKNKAFFFANYEGFRQHTANEVLLQTPDLAARGCQGMTVQACQAMGGVNLNATPVINGKPVPYPACNAATAYPGANPCTAQLNIESLMSLLPIGTFSDNPASGIADSFGNFTQQGAENYGMVRFDYTISDKDSFFVRYVTDTAKLVTPQIVPVNPATQWTASTYATIQERRIFSPTLINTIAVSFNRPLNVYHQYGSPTVTEIGNTPIQAYADCQGCPANQPMMYFPADGFLRETGSVTPVVGTAGSGFGAAPATSTGLVAAGAVTPFYEVPNHFTYADDVVWTKGAHSLHIGMSVERLRDNTFEPLRSSGSWSSAPLSGTSGTLGGFLSGSMSSISGILPNSLLAQQNLPLADSTNDSREWIYAPYVQDDWKVTSRVTLNIGLRYQPTNDVNMVRHATGNVLAAPFPNVYGSTVATTNSGGTTLGNGPYPAGTDCLNANGQFNGVKGALLGCGWIPVTQVTATNVSLKNIDPRIGVAWDPFKDHKTSVRAGFGIFHTVLTARDFDYWDNPPERIAANTNFSASLPANLANTVCGNANCAVAGSPYGYPFAFPSAQVFTGTNCVSTTNPPWQNCATAGPGNYYGQNKTPYTMQWTASVQREVLPQTIISLTYVGSRGVDLEGSYNFNSLTACGGVDPVNGQYIFTPQLGDTVHLPGDATHLPGTEQFVQGNYISCPNLNPAYGNFSYTNAMYDSWYQAGTISLNRSFSHGLQAQLGYTYSKSIDNASATYGGEVAIGGTGETGGLDPYNLQLGKAVSTWDRANNLRLSGIYSLPFNRNQFVAGWQITAIYSYLSGDPFSITGLSQGTPGSYPNYVSGCNVYTGVTPQEAVNVNLKNGLATNPYVNANCFSLQNLGEYGSLGRNSMFGPTNWNLDMSLIKDTKVTRISENFVVEFRAEFFNILNHPYWSVPTNLTVWTYNSAGAINTAGVEGANSSQPTFGAFGNPASTPREIQFGLRVSF